MTLSSQQHNQSTHLFDEQILVIKRSILFPKDDMAWHGIKQTSFDKFVQLINHNKEFHPRSLMEQDPRYKQIIPYLIFKHINTYFLMQRTATTREQRLKNKFSLGIGGHIKKEDLNGTTIMEWAKREFYEEVHYQEPFKVTALGILNDDSNSVGQVHIGFVLLLEGQSPAIRIKSELKNGQLLSLSDCAHYYPDMETWSQMVYDTLSTHTL